jgi:hypothetical protein
MRVPVGVAVLVAISSLSHTMLRAEIYRWTDKEGRVHFSDREPDTRAADVRMVDVRGNAETLDPELEDQRARGRKLLEVWDAERNERASAAAAAEQARAAMQQRCEWVARELDRVNNARVLYRRGDDGGRQYLESGERDRYAKELLDWRDDNCR